MNRRLVALLSSGAAIAMAALFVPSASASGPVTSVAGIVPGALVHLIGPAANGSATSTNWSGYAAYNTTFSDVQGTWVQPTAHCTSGSQYASFWVGLDGYKSSSVEQTGSSADCAGGSPKYYGWYEMYPAAPVNLTSAQLPVVPGNTMFGQVHYNGGGDFTLLIRNVTQNREFSIHQSLANPPLTSAEWVAEAPSRCIIVCQPLSLTNFGTVNFTGSYTTSGSGTHSISSYTNDVITMTNGGGTVKAKPSALSPDGTSFSVAWKHK